MLKLFVSSLCPHCPPAIETVKRENLKCEIIDITASMQNLKQFLSYRDKCEYFDDVKAQGRVGIPTVMIDDGKEFFSFEENVDIDFLRKHQD